MNNAITRYIEETEHSINLDTAKCLERQRKEYPHGKFWKTSTSENTEKDVQYNRMNNAIARYIEETGHSINLDIAKCIERQRKEYTHGKFW